MTQACETITLSQTSLADGNDWFAHIATLEYLNKAEWASHKAIVCVTEQWA